MCDDKFSDNEEDWFFDSINRYKKLNMFELQKTPYCIEFSNPQNICVVSEFNDENSELTELQLPVKSVTDDTLSNDSDLKLRCGTLTKSVVSQIQVQFGKNKVFTSQIGENDVAVYDIYSETGQMQNYKNVKSPLINPQIALNCVADPQIFISNDTRNKSYLIDVVTERITATVNTLDDKNNIADCSLMPLFISSHSVSVLNRNSGSVITYDARINSSTASIKPDESLSDNNFWTFNCDFIPHLSNDTSVSDESFSKLYLLSDNGTMIVYDSRNWNNILAKCDININLKSDLCKQFFQLKCCPFNKNVVSISGFDSNIYVYLIEKNIPELLFTHDGHSHVENCEKDTISSAHLWNCFNDTNCYQVLSCALNKTLHFWEFSY